MLKKNLLSILASAAITTLVTTALISSCQESYNNSKPGIVYLVKGKKVLERRFDTNEEFRKYLDSDQGKKENEYYLRLNGITNDISKPLYLEEDRK